MKEFIDSISSREQVVLLIFVLIFIAILFSKSIRASLFNVIQAFLAKQILLIYSLAFLYAILITFIFYKLKLWDINLLKDTIFWILGTAFIMVFDSVKAKDFSFIKETLKDTFKWTIFIEFVIGFYTFNFWIELIIVPFLTFIGILIAYSDVFKDKLTEDEKRLTPILNKVLSFFGIILFIYILYKTISFSKDLFTIDNLKSVLLPIIFTILFLPFAYFVALYSTYEILWIRLKFGYTKEQSFQLKKHIFHVAQFNLKKLSNISENLAKPTLVYDDFSLEMVRTISKGKYIGFDE